MMSSTISTRAPGGIEILRLSLKRPSSRSTKIARCGASGRFRIPARCRRPPGMRRYAEGRARLLRERPAQALGAGGVLEHEHFLQEDRRMQPGREDEMALQQRRRHGTRQGKGLLGGEGRQLMALLSRPPLAPPRRVRRARIERRADDLGTALATMPLCNEISRAECPNAIAPTAPPSACSFRFAAAAWRISSSPQAPFPTRSRIGRSRRFGMSSPARARSGAARARSNGPSRLPRRLSRFRLGRRSVSRRDARAVRVRRNDHAAVARHGRGSAVAGRWAPTVTLTPPGSCFAPSGW